MASLVLFFALTALLGVASVMGWTHDSRDSAYSLGAVLRPRPKPPSPTLGECASHQIEPAQRVSRDVAGYGVVEGAEPSNVARRAAIS